MADADRSGPSPPSSTLRERLARVDRGWWATAIGLAVVGLAVIVP